MFNFNYKDIQECVKNIFLKQRDGYDCKVNDETILSVDWEEDLGKPFREGAWVSVIINRNRVKCLCLGDYEDEEELSKEIYNTMTNFNKVVSYVNSRIKQEQKESNEWIDRILNAESTEEAERVLKEYNQKKYAL